VRIFALAPFAFAIVLLTSPSANAQGSKQVPPGYTAATKHGEIAPEPLPPPAPRRTDPVKLQRDAQTLAELANSVPSDIAQLNQGLLSKELLEKLRRIEKLSKQLRSELNP
jgi:hypothetical protein